MELHIRYEEGFLRSDPLELQDLAVDQIRKGLAHAMTVTKEGADAVLMAAQRYAIKHKKGMWAHGVPEYVMTSLPLHFRGLGGLQSSGVIRQRAFEEVEAWPALRSLPNGLPILR